MRRSFRNQTKRLAVCAVLASLGTVMLGLGVLVEAMDLTCAALAALAILPVLLTYGTRWAMMTYAVVAVLGVVLMPQSLSAWLYAGLVGYYPVLKPRVDRLPRLLSWLIKALLVAAALAVYLVIFYFLILGGSGSIAEAFVQGFGENGSMAVSWLLVGLSLLAFFLFDLLIDRLLILYRLKWKGRFDRWMR